MTSYHDKERLSESNGVLTYESPIDAMLYDDDMTVVTKQTLTGAAVQRFEVAFRIDSYRRIRVLRILDAETDS